MRADTESTASGQPRTVRQIVDHDGRRLQFVRRVDGDAGLRDGLRALYDRFEDTDRAQGIPPASPERRREWFERFLDTPGVGVAACHDDRVVGHGRLLGDGDGPAELAVFVDSAYQNAGVGTSLLRTLLSVARERGLPEVVLSVERSNTPARTLYRRFGFETVNRRRFEIEMRLSL